MKKLIALFAVLLLSSLFPSAVHSTYLLHLENGGQFTTPHYWEEGGNIIFFYVPGGLMGIEKRTVMKIDTLAPRRETGSAIVAAPPVSLPETSQKTPAMGSKAPTPPLARQRNPEESAVMREFNLLKERMAAAATMTTEELYAFEKELTAFRNKILAARLGHLYSDQLLETANMGGKVEELLKAKAQ
ncbi:MAG: hypothetical protein K0B01_02720 [Syntrophobacterales bacterium]|nr:hypothetical protein [Syntrophobacterales bacterium]